MKKLLPVIVLILITVTACKKTDNTTTTTPDLSANAPTLIIGQWQEGPQLSVYYNNGIEVYRETDPQNTRFVYRKDGTMEVLSLNSGTTYYTTGITFKYSFANSNKTIVISNNGTSTYGITFTDNNTWTESFALNQTSTIHGISYTSYSYTATVTRM